MQTPERTVSAVNDIKSQGTTRFKPGRISLITIFANERELELSTRYSKSLQHNKLITPPVLKYDLMFHLNNPSKHNIIIRNTSNTRVNSPRAQPQIPLSSKFPPQLLPWPPSNFSPLQSQYPSRPF